MQLISCDFYAEFRIILMDVKFKSVRWLVTDDIGTDDNDSKQICYEIRILNYDDLWRIHTTCKLQT